MIQTMENPFLCLKSVIGTWLSCTFSPWMIDTIFPILLGGGLCLLLLILFDREPSSPPSTNHRNIRRVSNPWPKPNRDDLFSYFISIFSKSLRESPEMGILRKEWNITLLGTRQPGQGLEQAWGFLS